MNTKNRDDFSYDLWGDPELAIYDGNKVTFQMNPKYGSGKSISLDSVVGLYPTLSEHCLNFKIKNSNIFFFKKDVLFIGKVLNGKLVIKGKDNLSLLFKKGELFCFSGNLILDNKHYYNDERSVLLVGIFGYKNDILNSFRKNGWSTNLVKKVLENSVLKTALMINKTYQIEQILSDLYCAMSTDDRFTSFVRGVDLFHYFVEMMANNQYSKAKTYTEQQVDNVIEIKNFLDNNLDTYYSMPKLAEMFNVSLSRMQSIFADYYNDSPYRYHLNRRLEKANDLILNTDIKIITIAVSVGFTSYDNFFKAYKNKYGFNPSKHRMT